MIRDVLHPQRRLHRTWTAPAGRVETVPSVEPDERDGMTLEEMEEMAQRDREQQELEDEPA